MNLNLDVYTRINSNHDFVSESSEEKEISCVIPTYNRCPYRKRIEHNPIWWAAHSLFKQKNIGEIIFVDDKSDDFFLETVKGICKSSPTEVTIRYTRNKERQGSGESRNIGVDMVSNNRVFFYDDDCVLTSDNILEYLNFAYTCLKNEGIPVGAMNLPVNGDSLEALVVPASNIGRYDYNTGLLEGCETKFPKNYEANPEYLEKDRNILRPVEVDYVWGVFLADKQAYLNAGGFPTNSWKGGCAEELELMFNMKDKGYRMFYLPSKDLNFRVFHFRWGMPSVTNAPYNIDLGGVSFQDALKSSMDARRFKNHGNRIDKIEGFYSWVLSNMRIAFQRYGMEAGFKNLSTFKSKLNGDYRMGEAFYRAVEDGINLLKKEGSLTKREVISLTNKYFSGALL